MLDDRPGIVLADEVGMGKTYEALGVAAATRHTRDRSRIVVITPGPDLNGKWASEFSRFSEIITSGTMCGRPASLTSWNQSDNIPLLSHP